jgi:hypothetical protein
LYPPINNVATANLFIQYTPQKPYIATQHIAMQHCIIATTIITLFYKYHKEDIKS